MATGIWTSCRSNREGGCALARHGSDASKKIEWESYHHDDPQNTGNYDTKLPVRAAPKPVKKGCHCGESGPETIFQLFAALAFVRRFRRRRATA